MKRFFTLLRWESRRLFLSPAAILLAALVFLLLGLVFLLVLGQFARQPQTGRPLSVFMDYFWAPVLALIPPLTAKTIDASRRDGTLAGLLMAPVTGPEIIAGKFLVLWSYHCLLWILFFGAITAAQSVLGLPAAMALYGPLDRLCGLIFVLIGGGLYLSIGLLIAVVCRNPHLASGLSFSLLAVLTLGPRLDLLSACRPWSATIFQGHANIYAMLEQMRAGIFSGPRLIFYLTMTLFLLALAALLLPRIERR